MWLKCKAYFHESEEEEEKDPILERILRENNPEEGLILKDYCFNSVQVKDFNKTNEEGVINVMFYDNTSMSIVYDFDEMYELKISEDPTINYKL